MTEAQEIRRGYEQFLPPQPPPGMHFDPGSGLFLPQGVQLASRGRVAAAWFLGFLLFIATLGIGYLIWSIFAWKQARSPAQKMLGLRCWQPESRRLAGRKQMALRQITGFCLNGQLLAGFFIWLIANDMRSVGDFFADTVILHDPDGVLRLSRNAHGDRRHSRQEIRYLGEERTAAAAAREPRRMVARTSSRSSPHPPCG